ncbi:MAG: hypothetical protein L0323_19585 [Planctomycetes bacterium]|nr:hypothetical protein [Planctomycetota bacterium]
MNSLLDEFSMQARVLRRGDPTFRRSSKRLDYLRPVGEYLLGASRHAFEDFVQWHPVWRARFEKRDGVRDALERAAVRFFETLVGDPKFRREALGALADYRKTHPRAEYPGGAARDPQFPDVVAEQLVNDETEAPEHYTVARFWNGYQRRFDAYRRDARAPEIGRSLGTLLREAEEIGRDLREFRFELCDKYDIPAVPYEVPPVR